MLLHRKRVSSLQAAGMRITKMTRGITPQSEQVKVNICIMGLNNDFSESTATNGLLLFGFRSPGS